MFSILDISFADKGVYVNLDTSTDRKEHVEKQINKYNIKNLERFSGLTDELRQCTATKSQKAVFEKAIQEGCEVIFVAEDDFEILDTIKQYNGASVSIAEHLGTLKQELDTLDWDVFLFGCAPRTHLIPYTCNISLVHKSTGAWAYLIKKRAMQYILDNFSYTKDYLAIDDILPALNFHGFKTFCATPITIHHAKGFISTLNPQGPVNYDSFIEGSYHKYLEGNVAGDYLDKYKLERELTIVITGHFVENFLFYLRYLLYSLPQELKKCKFIVYYDHNPNVENPILPLVHYFYNRNDNITYNIKLVKYGLIDAVKHALDDITTPYFLFLEHDWVFLKKDNINFRSIIDAFDKYNFIHSVYLNKDDNQLRGVEICQDITGITTPYQLEDRVKEINLLTTCRWSNNPCIHRTSKFKEWYKTYLESVHNNVGHGQHDVEEVMIPAYRELISKSNWMDIRDNWGTYLYGNIGDGPYVGHTDASRRYLTSARSQPEIDGDEYIKNNPLPEHD
jgi:GR25 family glycosyltransferase involved in LPS biosynthesis